MSFKGVNMKIYFFVFKKEEEKTLKILVIVAEVRFSTNSNNVYPPLRTIGLLNSVMRYK